MAVADLDSVGRTIFAGLGSVAGVWSTWTTVIAFTGGTVPLVGWEIEGGPLFFFFGWLFINGPTFDDRCLAGVPAHWPSPRFGGHGGQGPHTASAGAPAVTKRP